MTAPPFVRLDGEQQYPEGSAEALAMSDIMEPSLEEMLETEPAFSEDIPKSPEPEYPDEDSPSTMDALGLPSDPIQDADYREALEACYGEGFPLASAVEPKEDDWCNWAEQLWDRHSLPVMDHLWITERNRRMRVDDQWISSANRGPWREPPKPSGQARIVRNVIAPALDQRVELVSEQRPGFRVEPAVEGSTQKNQKRAEAQQAALEYQWRQQRMQAITREACYWNGTDAVAFLHSFWDPDRGPMDEVMTPRVQKDGTEVYESMRQQLGDLATEVLRVEQVRVDAGATANTEPKYWIVRKVIARATAIKRWGVSVAKADTEGTGPDDSAGMPNNRASFLGADQVDANLLGQETVVQFYVYVDRTEYLPEGLMIMCVGGKLVVEPSPLQFGCVPVVRWADGSTDSAFYPRAVMNGWVPTQMLINALESRLIESVRKNSGGRISAREGAIVSETLVGGVLSVINIREGDMVPSRSINDVVQPFPSFSVGQDLTTARDSAMRFFEQLSGWNDATRGGTPDDRSGRAILAQREAVERIFNPPITAASEAMAKWAQIQLAGMRWGYDIPRMIAVQGDGRPDLAMAMQADDFDGAAEVTVNPETLVPLPRSYRLMLLDQLHEAGHISSEEWRRRHPIAYVQSLESPDKDQYDRAKRVAEAIRQSRNSLIQPGQPYAILWVDDEAIHQDVLQRELILPDDMDLAVRAAALERWMALGQQAQFKMGTSPTPGGQPPREPQQGGGKPGGSQLPAGQQPFMSTNPSIAAGTAATMSGANNQDSATREFEARASR